jgi:hypothetical protein
MKERNSRYKKALPKTYIRHPMITLILYRGSKGNPAHKIGRVTGARGRKVFRVKA